MGDIANAVLAVMFSRDTSKIIICRRHWNSMLARSCKHVRRRQISQLSGTASKTTVCRCLISLRMVSRLGKERHYQWVQAIPNKARHTAHTVAPISCRTHHRTHLFMLHAEVMRWQLTLMLKALVHHVCSSNLKTLRISTNTGGQALSLLRQMKARMLGSTSITLTGNQLPTLSARGMIWLRSNSLR